MLSVCLNECVIAQTTAMPSRMIGPTNLLDIWDGQSPGALVVAMAVALTASFLKKNPALNDNMIYYLNNEYNRS